MNQKSAYFFLLHDFEFQSFQCNHCDILHFKNETVQSNKHYFSCCLNDSVKLFIFHLMSIYLKNLLITDTTNTKHFQQQINIYNNTMIFTFCMFNQDEHLSQSAKDIQSFVI